MNQKSDKDLFSEHLGLLQARLWKAAEPMGYECLVISSGRKEYYFADDQSIPFERTPHFIQWCPAEGEGHLLILKPGRKPQLVFLAADDFWHEPARVEGFWNEFFDIKVVKDIKNRFEQETFKGKTGFIGIDRNVPEHFEINPEPLTKAMDWLRSYKTPWEVELLRRANRIAACGHKAAEACFLSGGSEFDIHSSYLYAVKQTDDELPYGTIVGLNEHAGFLHYESKELGSSGSVLLIDAGARVHGYGSDITRTYAGEHGRKTKRGRAVSKEGLDVFKGLLKEMDLLQHRICSEIKTGMAFAALHKQTCLWITDLLEKAGIVTHVGAEESLRLAVSRVFLPHGLGHMLGVQVHDVGGHQFNLAGKMFERNQEFPSLRNYRTIEEGHVFTIEPGLYFIPMLLRDLRTKFPSVVLDWRLIDELLPCGGIRIEDNLYVSSAGVENLTRPAFSSF
jgi:Xaa-Pro dipeptidase